MNTKVVFLVDTNAVVDRVALFGKHMRRLGTLTIWEPVANDIRMLIEENRALREALKTK